MPFITTITEHGKKKPLLKSSAVLLTTVLCRPTTCTVGLLKTVVKIRTTLDLECGFFFLTLFCYTEPKRHFWSTRPNSNYQVHAINSPQRNCACLVSCALWLNFWWFCRCCSPADRLPPSTEPKLLVASYAWDGNAFPGNEYWEGLIGSSGDPAAVCCSTIGELQNAWINTGFLDRQHLIQPNKSQCATAGASALAQSSQFSS